jgi:four helix bundle protein
MYLELITVGEMKDNVVNEKSYAFALRIIQMYKHLSLEKKEFVLSKQILRSGTSIGANVVEADAAISKAEFSAKISIAYKEACETCYWLRLLLDSNYIDKKSFSSIFNDAEELCKLLYSILNSSGRIKGNK